MFIFDTLRYTVVSDVIHSLSLSPRHDSVYFTALYAASGVLRGIPRAPYAHLYTLLQSVLVAALHQLPQYSLSPPDEGRGEDFWESAVGFVFAHSGLCSRHTPLGIT